MRTLIPHYQEPHFLSIFPSISLENKKPIFFHYKKCYLRPQKIILSSISASCNTNSASSYNGWGELMIRVDSDDLGQSNYIKRFLLLMGFDDKKYLFTCILGFVCGLAISRVRVSSLVVFPACAIVFAIGFSFGFVNGGKPNKGLIFGGGKTRVRERDDSLNVFVEKLRDLVDLFDGFYVKVNELKNDIKKAIDFESVEVGDLEGYVDVAESIGVFVLNARNVVDDCIDCVLKNDQEINKNLIKKNGRKNKEIRNNGFDLFGFMGSFLRDNRASSKLSKIDHVKRGENIQGSAVKRQNADYMNRTSLNDLREKTNVDDVDLRTERNSQSGEMDNEEAAMSRNRFCRDDRFSYEDLRYMNYRRVSSNMSAYREIRRWKYDDSMSSNIEYELGKRAYEYNEIQESNSYASYMENFQERMNVEDKLHSRKYLSQQESGVSSFESATVADDVLFDKCLTNANDLLKQAKECLQIADNEMLAEKSLHESAQLLSQAIAMKPMSLLALGQLGNTYLLHGELKLRSSRELRRILSKSDDFGSERRSNLLNHVDETLPNRERIANLLVNVCEECETLLVEAGRKYRTALAIDGNDLRALYNWGLALSYRAQLIADIGPEAALDADKLFLAAIDKFDAMMSRSNVYTAEALYRWGAALQQRSRLRPSNNRDKVKLLQQAKTLYEDALDMGSDSLQEIVIAFTFVAGEWVYSGKKKGGSSSQHHVSEDNVDTNMGEAAASPTHEQPFTHDHQHTTHHSASPPPVTTFVPPIPQNQFHTIMSHLDSLSEGLNSFRLGINGRLDILETQLDDMRVSQGSLHNQMLLNHQDTHNRIRAVAERVEDLRGGRPPQPWFTPYPSEWVFYSGDASGSPYSSFPPPPPPPA